MLHLTSCPRCFPEKFQAGIQAGFMRETANWNSLSKFLPSVGFHQTFENLFEGNAVKGIVLLNPVVHCVAKVTKSHRYPEKKPGTQYSGFLMHNKSLTPEAC